MMIQLPVWGGERAWVSPGDITCMTTSRMNSALGEPDYYELSIVSCSGDYHLQFDTAAQRDEAAARINACIEAEEARAPKCRECGR